MFLNLTMFFSLNFCPMKRTLLISLILLISSIILGQATITLKVEGMQEVKGDMSVALYDNADDFPGKENYFFAEDVSVESLDFTFTFKDIPHGTYAIAIYHDVDKNGEMNKNWMGIPKEPYGFSNNVMGRMGPPDFEDAGFEVKGNLEIVIQLKD